MSEDTYKNVLCKFYGLDSDCEKDKNLSSSKGIEHFENVTNLDKVTQSRLSTEETRKNQNDEDELHMINDVKKDTTSWKSPHVLTINDLYEKKKEGFQEPDTEVEIIGDSNDKCIATKSLTRLEDTFTKAIAKISDSPVKSGNAIENSTNLSTASATKAKKLWRQKTILSKENIVTPANLMSKYNGVFLDLNNAGITDFPVDILQHLRNLRMLYLESNNLEDIPKDLFVVLNRLQWLDVRNNQLTAIPTTVKGHESLETLLLQGNSIEKLPLELGLVPNLKNLQTAYNPLVFPPQEILDLDCSIIINFLRKKWNEQHEDEQVDLKEMNNDELKKKPSTIICYQHLGNNLHRKKIYHKLIPKSSVRMRSWSYRPSSRCMSAGLDSTCQQTILWKNAAKKLLADQAAELQKLMDRNILSEWKCSYSMFKHKKIASKYCKDAPFALHTEPEKQVCGVKTKKELDYQYDVYEDFKQVQQFLKALENDSSVRHMTPRSKQLQINTEINKLNELCRNINRLKFYTESISRES